MMKKLLALSLAGALVAPQLGSASESRLNENGVQVSISDRFPLPAIPYLDTMPWINLGHAVEGTENRYPADAGLVSLDRFEELRLGEQ